MSIYIFFLKLFFFEQKISSLLTKKLLKLFFLFAGFIHLFLVELHAISFIVHFKGVFFVVEIYIPVLIFFIFSFIFGIVPVILGSIIAPKNPNREKLSQYECGFEPFDDSRMKFNIKFYFVGILFIIFDLEIAFLFPWAVCIDIIGLSGFIAMGIFLAVLTIGFIYEWKKGALEWE